ncbi:hypothetical protein BJX96DRAFT_178290 [Aspergillus floccosus]
MPLQYFRVSVKDHRPTRPNMKSLTYLFLLLGISATTALASLCPDATPEEVAAPKLSAGP